jgi:hypothetical protein
VSRLLEQQLEQELHDARDPEQLARPRRAYHPRLGARAGTLKPNRVLSKWYHRKRVNWIFTTTTLFNILKRHWEY